MQLCDGHTYVVYILIGIYYRLLVVLSTFTTFFVLSGVSVEERREPTSFIALTYVCFFFETQVSKSTHPLTHAHAHTEGTSNAAILSSTKPHTHTSLRRLKIGVFVHFFRAHQILNFKLFKILHKTQRKREKTSQTYIYIYKVTSCRSSSPQPYCYLISLKTILRKCQRENAFTFPRRQTVNLTPHPPLSFCIIHPNNSC